jgi:hypothetical protein
MDTAAFVISVIAIIMVATMAWEVWGRSHR